MKGHVRLLLAKATTDDQLIDAMRAEMKEGRERMLRDTHAAGSSAGGEHHSDGEARVLKQTIEQVCVWLVCLFEVVCLRLPVRAGMLFVHL